MQLLFSVDPNIYLRSIIDFFLNCFYTVEEDLLGNCSLYVNLFYANIHKCLNECAKKIDETVRTFDQNKTYRLKRVLYDTFFHLDLVSTFYF